MSHSFLAEMPFQCCSHRGYTYDYVENTIPGFKRSVELGATMVEMDVQLTADGQVVVFHDSTLERLAESSHAIAGQPWEALREVELYDRKAQIDRRGQMPLFSEVLEALGDSVFYYVELKYVQGCPWDYHERLCLAVWQMVSRYNLLHKALFVSFEYSMIEYLKRVWRAGFLGANIMRSEDLWHLVWRHHPDELVLCPEESLLQEQDLEELVSKGYRVIPWVVNDEARMRWLWERGVAGVTTSHVGTLKGVMDSGKEKVDVGA